MGTGGERVNKCGDVGEYFAIHWLGLTETTQATGGAVTESVARLSSTV